MTITQPESGLSSDNYNALLTAVADIKPQFKVYRQNPAFDTYIGRISRDVSTPFSVAADDTLLVRAYNSAGAIYAENYSSSWSSPVLVDASGIVGVNPKVVKDGSTWKIFYFKLDGKVYLSTSADAATWSAGTAYSTVTFSAPDISFLSVALGAIPLVYVAYKVSSGSYNIVAVDSTAQYDTGIYWPNTIYEFDAIDFTAKADDTTGTHSNSDVRHCLVMSCRLPNIYTYKTTGGLPVKQAQPTGGIISFNVRPPIGSRPLETTRWYPIQIFDQWDPLIQARTSAKIMGTSSIFNSGNQHDMLWVSAVGVDGDLNVDVSYSYNIVAYYSSRDGKHWSQDKIIPLSTALGIVVSDFVKSVAIVKRDTKLYMLSATALVKSEGCLEFNNCPTALQLDITNRVLQYSSSIADARSSNLTLSNRDEFMWSTFLGQPGVYTLISKFGQGNDRVQVSVEEIDSIGPVLQASGTTLTEQVQVTTRDRLSWLTDRIENAHAQQWDNQLVALDTFTDINGSVDSGLAHTDTVKGVFSTINNSLIAKPKYQESIGFHTTGSGHISDGHCASIFTLPTPTGYGGTSSADSPTYAGVIFRALDKDNFWAVWYNYWTGRIELIERKTGSSTIKQSITPTVAFRTRADASNTVGLRVEFKGATIRIYESTLLYSAIGARYNPSYTYTMAPSPTALLEGYVGVIACGYSDQDSGETTDPGPILTISGTTDSPWGTLDAFQPTRFIALGQHGEFAYSTGTVGSPSWHDATPSGRFEATVGICCQFMADPYNLNGGFVVGASGITRNVTDWKNPAAWSVIATPPAGQTYNFTNAPGLIGSINWRGYFGWLEDGPGGRFYNYTHDNFVTTYRTALSGLPRSIAIGQYATSWNNIHLWISYQGTTTIERSTDGGQSFATVSYPVPGSGIFSTLAPRLGMAYSKPGGIPNDTYQGLYIDYELSPETPWRHYWLDFYGTMHNQDVVTDPQTSDDQPMPFGIATCTVDGTYLMQPTPANGIRVSNDAGVSWQFKGLTADQGGYSAGLNGWPTNPNFVVVTGKRPQASFTNGDTWFSLGLDFINWTWIQADLTERYDAGGVH